jgi:aryl-alcohol dehydrogenase-like predicted oxidoreductase
MRSPSQTSPAVSRLALGTAQFGLDYGIANKGGRISDEGAAAILATAAAAGVDTLDTATLYGDSEQRLGRIGVQAWDVVSKLPAVPAGCADVRAWVREEVARSLARLGIPRLAGLLLHRPNELGHTHGPALFAALEELREEKQVGKIGVSIYTPDELAPIVARHAIDLVQAPLNLLDRRLVRSGWLDRLAGQGVEVHARSVFLQGLLLMPRRPDAFGRWAPLWARWDQWLAANRQPALGACLQFVLSFPQIARVVVGVDSAEHLRAIVAAAAAGGGWPDDIWSDDPLLLNPSQWPQN